MQSYRVGTSPGSVAIGDFNGDGKPDIAVANEESHDVSVLLQVGARRFAAAPGSPFPAGNSPNDLAIADLDGDGQLDLAFANHETHYLTVLRGDGKGGFRPLTGSPVPVTVRPHPHGVAAGDFDGDGNQDLVTDSWADDELAVLFGSGQGRFRVPAIRVGVGDHPYQRIRVADVNGDARADIISPNLEGGDVTVLLGDGKGGFRAGATAGAGDSPFNVAIGDVNADRKLDLAIVNAPTSAGRTGRDGVTILIGDGRGGFRMAPGSPFETGRSPNMAAIGDIDGDGYATIVVSSPETDKIVLLKMSPAGAVSRRTRDVRDRPKGLAVYDLDGDGKAEIVVTLNGQNRVAVLGNP